jgi:hypothetical protein
MNMLTEHALNVTPEDKLNGLNAVNALCWRLMEKWNRPVRAIETELENDETDFRLELRNGIWRYFGRAESKSRTYYVHPLVSKNKIDTIWQQCQLDGVYMYVALWFDDFADRVYYTRLKDSFFDSAVTGWIAHSKRAGNGETGYEFQRAFMGHCPVYTKRLESPNSKR